MFFKFILSKSQSSEKKIRILTLKSELVLFLIIYAEIVEVKNIRVHIQNLYNM